MAVRNLPLHHRDPFDRLLIAQARCEGLTIVTADRAFAAYNVPIMPA
ncbi:MAG: type II toxin-antitoxin system VapC family toxin [Pseudonocardiaceae bacterium]